MKAPNVPGEFAFKALWKDEFGWHLTNTYYFNQKEITDYFTTSQAIWPVEELDNGAIYVPAYEEME